MTDPTESSDCGAEAPPQIEVEQDRSERWCRRCGGRNPWSWSVESDRWNLAMGDDQWLRNMILCPGCFVELHETASGLRCSWVLVPNPTTPFQHIEDDLS